MLRATTVCLALAVAHTTFAQTGAPLLLKPFDKGTTAELQAQSMSLASGSNTDADDQDFDLSLYDVSGRFTSAAGSELGKHLDGAALAIGFDFTYLSTDLEDSTTFPDQFVDQSVSIGMTGIKLSEWEISWQVGLGYAGTAPFGDGDAYYGLATLAGTRVLSREPGRFEALTILLDYDGNRSVFPDVPLPGFVYTKQVDEKLTLNLGFPFLGVTWKPIDKLTIDVLYAIPDFTQIRVGYDLTERLALFASLDSRTEAFHSNDLDNNLDRILFSQRRAELGIEYELWSQARFQIAGGYAFAQEFTQGFDARDDDEIFEPSDEPYLRTSLEVKW